MSEVVIFKAGLAPSAPSNLEKLTSMASSITLKWTASTATDIPIERYLLEYVELGGNNETQTISIAPHLTSYQLYLKSTLNYRFRILGVYFNDETAYSNELIATICGAPSQPLNFEITAFTLTTVTLEWNQPQLNNGCVVEEYQLFRDDGEGGALTNPIHTSELEDKPLLRSIAVTELPSSSVGNVIRFALNAINKAGKSEASYVAVRLVGVPDTPDDQPLIIERFSQTSLRMGIDGVTLTSGGLPLEAYRFEIAKQDSEMYYLIEESLQSQIDIRSPVNGFILTPGERYKSQYRSKNEFSYSLGYSPALSFLACYQPSQPSISRQEVTADNMTLSFQNPSDLGGGHTLTFELQISQQRSGTYTKVSTYDGQSSSHTLTIDDDSLEQGKSYYFKLRVTNESGLWSLFSDILMVALGTFPVAPTNIRHEITLTSANTVGIAWDAASDTELPILGYRVYKREENSSEMELVLDTSLLHPGRDTILAYSFQNANLGQTYIVEIASVNINGMGAVSSTVSITACVALQKSAIPILETSIASTTSIDTFWNGIANPTGCEVLNLKVLWSNADGDELANESALLSRSLSNYTIQGLSSLGSRYKVALKVETAISWVQGYSTSILLATRPSAPTTGPTAHRQNSESMTIEVSEASTADGNGVTVSEYQLQMNGNGAFHTVHQGSALSVVLYKGIHYNTTVGSLMYFRYAYINTQGTSDPSPELELTLADSPARCQRLELLNVTASAGIAINMTQLTDTGGAAIDNYTLEYSLESTHSYSSYKVYTAFQQTDILLTGLTEGEIYRFRIFASNVIAQGLPSSDLVVALADLPDIPAPGSLTVMATSSQNITLKWTAGSATQIPVSGYKVYYDENQSGNYSLLYDGSLKSYQLYYTHTSVTKGTLYRYRTSVLNFNGQSELLATPLQRYACDVPNQVVDFKATTINDTAIHLTWRQPQDNGGCYLSEYILEMNDGNSGAFSALASSPISSTDLEHTETASFNSGHLGRTFKFRIAASNVNGVSTEYAYAEALLAEKPSTPTTAPIFLNSTVSSIAVEMQVVSDANGGTIDWYQLEMDDGLSGDFIVVLGTTAQLNRIHEATSLVAVRSYSFRYRVHNQIGWSEYSPIVKYLVASSPDAPGVPLFVNSTSDTIFIEIQSSASNGGSPILSYAVYWDSGIYGSTFVHLIGSEASPFLDQYYSINTGLVPGNYYTFKVKAINSIGTSQYSDSVSVRAVSVPGAVSTIGFIQDSASIRISWDAPDSHGDPIQNYTILFKNQAGNEWHTLSSCDGTTSAIILNTFCTISMSSLSASPLGLVYNQDILLNISSTNNLGTSPGFENPDSSVKVITVPQAPSAAPVQGSSTSHTTLHVTWTALSSGAESGGADVVEYELVWDEGNATATEFRGIILSNALAEEFTTSTNVVAGTTYRFKYRARNLIGWGDYSPVGSVLAASAPEAASPPTTTTQGLKVKIDWSTPTDNGSPIQNYTVTLQNSSGDYVQVTGCDGTLSTTVQNTECDVLMATIRDELNLAYGADILAKVKATNLIGPGAESNATESNAATVETPPQTPSGLAASNIAATSMTVSWNSLTTDTELGGQPIKSYILEYKEKTASDWINGVGGTQISDYFIGNSTSIGSLSSTTTYQFRVSALNVHGQSPVTDPVVEATTL